MVSIYTDGREYQLEDTATYLDAAVRFFNGPGPAILVNENGSLKELRNPVTDGARVDFLTVYDPAGCDTYRRSVLMLMLKAAHDVVPGLMIRVLFSISKGLFCLTEDMPVTEDFLRQVENRMRELVDMDLPLEKESIRTEEALNRFSVHRMTDKEHLFRYRRASRVNLYRMGEFEDYYYGYMAPSTGMLSLFSLHACDDGFVLQMPSMPDPGKLAPFAPSMNIYRALRESVDRRTQLGIRTVGALNDLITGNINAPDCALYRPDGTAPALAGVRDLILVQEALMEKKIAAVADSIRKAPGKRMILIAGPSSSGKTTFSHRLSVQLRAEGLTPHPIEVDNYFVNRTDTPRDENGDFDFEALACVDIEQFSRDMTDLLAGKRVMLPTYNFLTGMREYRGNSLQLGEKDILVCEGIHCLNDALTPGIPAESKFRIYISALTQLNIDRHNRIPTTDGRLLRRLVRDARIRGNSARDTIAMWRSVRSGEEKNIFPYQENADIVFDSALLYEMAVLKSYAEPLLFGIGREEPEYLEAKRLLKFLDYFVGIDSSMIPANSIIREFIGGSCFGA